MTKCYYINGVFKKIPEEKKDNFDCNGSKKKMKKFSAMNFLTSLIAIGMISGAAIGFIGYALRLEKQEHQRYVNKANQNPSDMRAVRRDFVRIYQEERQKDTTASIRKLLHLSYRTLLKEIHDREKNDQRPYNPYDPDYNGGGKIYDAQKAGMVFEDLLELSKHMSIKEFEDMLKTYPEKDTKLLTTLDSDKKIKETLKRLRDEKRQRD